MEQSISVDIDAPIERVWEVLSDAEHWPEWTESVTWVRRLDDGPFRPGSRVKINQPRIPTVDWTVTELDPGRSFTWVSAGPGARTTARHRLEELPEGGTRAHLAVEMAGLVGALVGRLYAGLTRRYLGMEAAGLKRRCEGSDDLGVR